ncbi:hypothetical protein CHISP_2275 [Chitinispirillum alkaliphilum]|nr:hypothetical protein CHISP_2275 [Chitinispirillum alkaliphilum]
MKTKKLMIVILSLSVVPFFLCTQENVLSPGGVSISTSVTWTSEGKPIYPRGVAEVEVKITIDENTTLEDRALFSRGRIEIDKVPNNSLISITLNGYCLEGNLLFRGQRNNVRVGSTDLTVRIEAEEVTANAPDSFRGTITSDKHIRLNWSEGGPNKTGISLYRRLIQKSESDQAQLQEEFETLVSFISKEVLSYTDETGYRSGRVFEYKIHSRNQAGESPLYAVCTVSIPPDTFTVSFQSDHGDAIPPQSITDGGLVSRPTDPEKTGYRFKDWFTDIDGTVAWDFSHKKVSQDTTLYALWDLIHYEITYRLYDGVNSKNNFQYYTIHTETIVLEDPTRGEDQFGGWFLDSSYNTAIYQIEKGTLGDITLFAKWIEPVDSFTVTFKNSGESSVPQQRIASGEKISQPSVPASDGFTFGGWYSDSNFINPWHFTSDTVKEDMKLFAKWDPVRTGTVKDIDGNEYATIVIGNQEWTVQNIRTVTFSDGTPIAHITSDTEWKNSATPAYCFYNNTEDQDDVVRFGALYNWHVVDPENEKNIAPEGWRVPTNSDWNTLRDYLINAGFNWDNTTGSNLIGKAMAYRSSWKSSSAEGNVGNIQDENNRSGWSGEAGGVRSSSYGHFHRFEQKGAWWSSTEFNGSDDAYSRELNYNSRSLNTGITDKHSGLSVRLIRNVD